MLILLPPSETKRAGGTGRSLSLADLRFPELTEARRQLTNDVVELAADPDATIAALKLGPKQHAEVSVNRELWQSPTMPAIDRYTGVLFDALDASTLDAEAREFAARHVLVHAALFGPIGALDPIPAYRLSHDSRVPGRPMKRHWASPIREALAAHDGLLLDMRSEAYVALGPAPATPYSFYLRVLTDGPDGSRRALNHFNKKAKGEFTRALLEARVPFATADELCAWAPKAGFRLERLYPASGKQELALLV
ncbi:YaaA family protein [Mycetocola zhadangensis]|uniref:Peroxide stress protein YaaA n=1 Tax=Mycetocola zhadangensis TaxID=1164595 RepID=A0A3L7IV41_9MICO|nr:peroxide stress protein YaaA [Mycetocola zhadangensis]RLQ81401.1 peroxide stress protein YaaA [Mycetocola zhadangensis]GGF02001.1 peroxide stress protein YaaA [Mycetocola zhadangensis]